MELELRKALKDLLRTDKNLLRSLCDGDSDDEDPPSRKRKPADTSSFSPIRLKKVKLTPDAVLPSCSKDPLPPLGAEEVRTRSDETGSLPESNAGARNSSSLQDEGEGNELGILEQLLAGEQEDFTEEESEKNGSEADSDFEVIGGPTQASWKVRDKVFNWFKGVADIELRLEDLKDLKEKYKVHESLQTDFEPPKLPSSIWNTMNSNSRADIFRLRSLFKSQESLYLALIPLLSALDTAPKESREHLTAAIQLICHSNLSLNRYRRSTVIPYIKKELRKQMLSLPVTHNALFGEDFEKSTDSVLKEHSALNKVLIQRKPVQSRLGRQAARGNSETPFQFQGKRFRGKSRGGRGGHKNSGGGSARGSRGPKAAELGDSSGSSYNASA